MAAPKSLQKGFAKTVANAKPDPKKRITMFDPDTRGLCVRISPKGRKTYTIVARDPKGKQVWREVPAAIDDLTTARELAREGVERIKQGLEPFPKVEPPPPPDSFGEVAENFIKRYVQKNKLRSGFETERIFNKYILPRWKNRPFAEIRRSDVSSLLDEMEDENGPVQADRALAALSKLFNWHAARVDDYSTPIVPGMRRTKPKERARKRVWSDDEIRLIWPILDNLGNRGAFVKVLLLTGQRREKAATMRREDIDKGLWTIPAKPREKNNPGTLPLPEMVQSIIEEQIPVEGCPYIFPGRGKGPLAGFSPLKREIDKQLKEALKGQKTKAEPWVFHDLRRTAKSLMQRAGVRPDISERVLGHTIKGVEGVYDQHSYEKEKGDALKKLATLVQNILKPTPNVVQMRAGG